MQLSPMAHKISTLQVTHKSLSGKSSTDATPTSHANPSNKQNGSSTSAGRCTTISRNGDLLHRMC